MNLHHKITSYMGEKATSCFWQSNNQIHISSRAEILKLPTGDNWVERFDKLWTAESSYE